MPQIRFNNAQFNSWDEVFEAAASTTLEAIIARLADVGVTVYPYHRPQTIILPTITYEIVDQVFDQSLAGSVGLSVLSLQFMHYDYVLSEGLDKAEYVKLNLTGYQVQMGDLWIVNTLKLEDSQGTTIDTRLSKPVYTYTSRYDVRSMIVIPRS